MNQLIQILEQLQKELDKAQVSPVVLDSVVFYPAKDLLRQALALAHIKAAEDLQAHTLELANSLRDQIVCGVRETLNDYVGKPIPVSHAVIQTMFEKIGNLVSIVDRGPARDWRDNRGMRLKDTEEYVNLYLLEHKLKDLLDRGAKDFIVTQETADKVKTIYPLASANNLVRD